MLRLDPAHPPLWRGTAALQFGTADVARLEDPQPWELRVLAALERGLTDADLAALARAERVDHDRLDALFAELAPVLRRDRARPRVTVWAGIGIDARRRTLVEDALARGGAEIFATGSTLPPDGVVVLLAAHLVAPHDAASLVADDRAHLPLVLDDAGATVGPLVIPGTTGCLACEALHARDADPMWPYVATQLLGRPASFDDDVAVEAARVAVHVLSAGEDPPRSVRLRVDSPHRAWRQHRAHEECRCRSLGGTATEPVRLAPVRPAPSSPTGFARPA